MKQDSELNSPPTRVEGNALREIASLVTGDARKALNLLEISHAMAARAERPEAGNRSRDGAGGLSEEGARL